MMIETPPLGRQQDGSCSITAATNTIKAKEAASHLDLSLGISLSHGGGSGGDAGTKTSNYGCGCGGDAGCMGSGMLTAAATASVLGVGHGSSHDNTASSGGGSWTAAFMPSPTGFMHPWSLAARQQKAAAEQDRSIARLPPATYMPRAAPTIISLPAAVGWPPVHTSRRNLVATMNVLKPETAAVKMDRPTQAKTMFPADKTAGVSPRNTTTTAAEASTPLNMLAKVHMDGYKVGRKINLRAHRNYDTLRWVLTKMTRNFFCPTDYSSTNMGEDSTRSEEFIFLYEDYEGDRMLVGDIPWKLFLASAKRLYIAKNPAPRNKEHVEIAKRNETEEATDN